MTQGDQSILHRDFIVEQIDEIFEKKQSYNILDI